MKVKKINKLRVVIIAIFLVIGVCVLVLVNKNTEIKLPKITVQGFKALVNSKEAKNYIGNNKDDLLINGTKASTKVKEGALKALAMEKNLVKIAKTTDMINELAIGHTLSFASNQSADSYTNENIVFDITISEVDYETEIDIDTLINSLIESVGEENAQSVIDGINNGEIYSLEGFPHLKKFKVIMKDATSGAIIKQVDLSSEINNNSLETQLTVEQNCIIEIEGIISSKIEFYDSEENVNMECSWDDVYTSENFLEINQIDKISPTITISPNGATTSQSQNITITAEDKGVSGLNSNNSYQYQLGTSNTEVPTGTWQDYTSGTEFTIGEGLTGDYYIWIKSIYDNAGNKSSETEYMVSNRYIFDNTIRDTTGPTINSVTGNATEWTNQSVTLTINAIDNESGIAGYSFDNGENWQTTNSKTYTVNTSNIKIKVKDNAGNITLYEQTINIDKIDKTAPTITITPNGANISQSKEVTINVADLGGSGLSGENSYQYQLGTSNIEVPTGTWQDYTSGIEFTIGEGVTGDYYIWVKTIVDNAGNEAIESDYMVSNKFIFDNSEVVDTLAPELSVEYSTTQLTNKTVTVTIKSNEEIQEVDGWTISADDKTLTKVYTKNATENIDVYDLAGNKSTVLVKITNIDKTEIEATVEYSTTILTNKNVTVKIISNKEIKEVDDWTLLEDKKTLTKKYAENSKEDIILQDSVGNKRELKISVQNIDKIAPELDVEYSTLKQTNKSITVTIAANEDLKSLEGWTLKEDGKTLTKIYSKNITENIDVYDLAGNKVTAKITINNIDTILPNIEVKYSTIEKTKEDVVVTIVSDKQLQKIDGWAINEDGKTLTKKYEKNTVESVKVYDLAGNEISVDVSVRSKRNVN